MNSRRGHRSGSSLCPLLVGHVLGENLRFLLNPGVSRFALWVFQVTFWAWFFDTKFSQFNFACIRPIDSKIFFINFFVIFWQQLQIKKIKIQWFPTFFSHAALPWTSDELIQKNFFQKIISLNVVLFSYRVCILDDRSSTYINQLREVVTQDVDMIVAIVPDAAGDRYSAIKRFLSCDNAGNFRSLEKEHCLTCLSYIHCQLIAELWKVFFFSYFANVRFGFSWN